jgi:cytochrome c oxidase cbb3-type subunit IV
MDLNDLRSLVTVVSLLLFIGIVRWAWARRNQSRFDEAANLPFVETLPPAVSGGSTEATRDPGRPA